MTSAVTAAGPGLTAVRWWDVPELVELERALFPDDAWTATAWWSELAQSASRTYVLLRDDVSGRVAGYAGVAVTGAVADVMTVAVSPHRRGCGLGRRLVDALVVVAADRGAHQMVLEVRADNVAAQRLYAAAGFERIAVRRGYYRGVDAWVLRRRPLVSGAAAVGSVQA